MEISTMKRPTRKGEALPRESDAAGWSVQSAAGRVSYGCRVIIDSPHITHTIHRMNALLCHTPLGSPHSPSGNVTDFMTSLKTAADPMTA
jgi:hypothetical protein